MNELIKNKLAIIGATRTIQKIFSFGEVNDTQINKLKMFIEYYEQLKKEQRTLIKNHGIDSDPNMEDLLDMFKGRK